MVAFNSFVTSVFKLQSAQGCPAVFLIHFIFVAVILLVSLALMVRFSLPYNEAANATVFYNFIFVFFEVSLWSKHIVHNARYFQTVI